MDELRSIPKLRSLAEIARAPMQTELSRAHPRRSKSLIAFISCRTRVMRCSVCSTSIPVRCEQLSTHKLSSRSLCLRHRLHSQHLESPIPENRCQSHKRL